MDGPDRAEGDRQCDVHALLAEATLQLGLAEAGTDSEAAALHLDEARRTLSEPELVSAATYALARILLFVGRAQEGADMASASREGLPEHLSDIADMIESVELVSAYFGAEVPDVEERLLDVVEQRLSDAALAGGDLSTGTVTSTETPRTEETTA